MDPTLLLFQSMPGERNLPTTEIMDVSALATRFSQPTYLKALDTLLAKSSIVLRNLQ